MNLELTDEQVALRETVRRYLSEKASVSAHVRPMLDSPSGTTGEVWHGLAALGAVGVLVPEAFGGAGMTMVDAGVVAEELGSALHPGPWLSSAVAATRALTRMARRRCRRTADRHRRRFDDRHRRPARRHPPSRGGHRRRRGAAR